MATIEQLLQFPHGAAVQELHCRVSKAFAQRQGQGQYGPWTVMDLELTDTTGTMRAQWWYNLIADPAHVMGQDVLISATKNEKGTLQGAKIDIHEHQGKTYRRIKVDGERLAFAAHVAAAATPTNGHAQAASAPPAAPATQPTPPPTTAPASAASAVPARLTLTEYLSAAGRAYRYATDVLGVTDQQAAVAFADTAAIATSNGHLVIDQDRDSDAAPF